MAPSRRPRGKSGRQGTPYPVPEPTPAETVPANRIRKSRRLDLPTPPDCAEDSDEYPPGGGRSLRRGNGSSSRPEWSAAMLIDDEAEESDGYLTEPTVSPIDGRPSSSPTSDAMEGTEEAEYSQAAPEPLVDSDMSEHSRPVDSSAGDTLSSSDDADYDDCETERDSDPLTKLARRIVRDGNALQRLDNLVRQVLRESAAGPSSPTKHSHSRGAASASLDSSEVLPSDVGRVRIESPTKTTQQRLGAPFLADEKFDGVQNCLDHTLWAPDLREMYRELVPPQGSVSYVGRVEGGMLDPVPFHPWHRVPNKEAIIRLLKFKSNQYYVNPCRVSPDQLRVYPTGTAVYPKQFLARHGSAEPALFVTVVQVKHCQLLSNITVSRRDQSGNMEKRALVGNMLEQEFDLFLCTIGLVYGVDCVGLPSWSPNDDTRGLSYQTRLSQSSDTPSSRASRSRRARYNPELAATQTGRLPVQLIGAQRVPFFDATTEELDLDQPFSEFRRRSDLPFEAPVGSLCLAFYTIGDPKDALRLDFNLHAVALLAVDPQGSSAAEISKFT